MIKFLFDVRWNVADILLLPVAVRFLAEGNWPVAIMIAVAWLPLTAFVENYGRKNWGWR